MVDSATLGIVVTVIFGVIGIPSFVYYVGDKIPFLKSCNYWLRNKKIKVKIKSIRKYPFIDVNITSLKTFLINEISTDNKKIENLIFGKNYLELLLPDMQAPFRITISPEIVDVSDNEEIERIEVVIDLVGTIEFRYREDMDNRKYLTFIDNFFKIFQKKYEIQPSYENYSIRSTLTDFNESWSMCLTQKEGGMSIHIGTKVLDINSNTLFSLYDVYKKNIANI
jgi:hypothetical protein